MDVITLLDEITADADGTAYKVGDYRLVNGPIAFLIYGDNISATVNIQGTIATDAEVTAGTAPFRTINGGSFTEEAATALVAQFSHIRGQVISYSSGTVSLRMLI